MEQLTGAPKEVIFWRFLAQRPGKGNQREGEVNNTSETRYMPFEEVTSTVEESERLLAEKIAEAKANGFGIEHASAHRVTIDGRVVLSIESLFRVFEVREDFNEEAKPVASFENPNPKWQAMRSIFVTGGDCYGDRWSFGTDVVTVGAVWPLWAVIRAHAA